MKKILFLIVASLFVFSGVFGADSNADVKENSKEKVEFSVEKAKKDIEQVKKEMIKTFKAKKKAYKKLLKDQRKKIKDSKGAKETLNNMLLMGALILVGGLLLYLIVSSARWLGIIVMVVGIVLLLYGALKKFF